MDTFVGGGRRRRRHSAEFKAKVVQACRQPGVSMAAVALANGLNANLLRRWVVTAERTEAADPGVARPAALAASMPSTAAFVPVEVPRSLVATVPEIVIELRRGPTVVKVSWPVAAAAACGAWLGELLR